MQFFIFGFGFLLFGKTPTDLLLVFFPLQTSGFDMEYWKMQNLDFYQLKKLTIECYNYDLNGVVLAKYIFEHAQNLEEFAIYPYQA